MRNVLYVISTNSYTWSKRTERQNTCPCSEIMRDYNSVIGGIDLFDQKTDACKLDRKSPDGRYYLRLFFDLIDTSVVN